jgi:hypothetical protein
MKRKLILITLFLYSISFYSQRYGYTDLSILFSQDDYRGTARFNAMSGSFGALGGDVSALYINPASGAVFNNSEFSGSLSTHTTDTQANYYGTNTINNHTNFRLPQMGIVFVFENSYKRSPWSKFSLGFNYSMVNDFSNNYTTKGDNDTPFAHSIFDDSEHNITDYQTFTNDLKGYTNVYSFTFSAAYEKTLYVGASINTHQTNLVQSIYLKEENWNGTNNDNNLLETEYNDYLSEVSNGVSLGIGIIGKVTNNLRLGLAFQSPIWHYDIKEETFDDYFNYTIKSPSKLTTSLAYIFNRAGLINIDYSFSNIHKTSLGGNIDFSNENEELRSILNNDARTLKIGTEWRLKEWSFRGGYSYQDSPFYDAQNKYDIEGYSFGIGLKMKNTKFDISYEKKSQSDLYDIYSEYPYSDDTVSADRIAPTSLNIDTGKITATLSFSF